MSSEDKITIKDLLDYPDKIYSHLDKIEIEGMLKRVNDPKIQRKEKTKTERGYHFTAQFLVVDDGTGSIGVNVTYPGDGPAIDKTAQGRKIKIENAEAGSYQSQRGTQRVLNRGRALLLEKVETTQKTENQNGYTTVPQEVWERKKLIETKTWIATKFIEVCKKWDKQIEKQATTSLKWIYNNLDKKKKEESEYLQNQNPKSATQQNLKTGGKTIKPSSTKIPVPSKKQTNASGLAPLHLPDGHDINEALAKRLKEAWEMADGDQREQVLYDLGIQNTQEIKTNARASQVYNKLADLLKASN